jgi:CrcB protein
MAQTLWIALGGAPGSVARYSLALFAAPVSRSLPWGTILVNVTGSFAIAFFATLTMENGRHPLPDTARLFFMVGVCGGFTTFSSFSLQTLDLLRAGALGRALANILLSVVLCLGSVAIGYAAGLKLNAAAMQNLEQ